MYKYHFSFINVEGEEFTRMVVRNHELTDEEVQQEMSDIIYEYDHAISVILEKVVRS